ncbi:ATP-binding protein [Streptomyces sp. JJ36]|uniref:ATP-binding protein n=1 Tax=Streptomyces sp. JJ36 TaxID=2736645 RepID=UPI001F2BA453|nr:ATP-binding protein [Streptomyces sp. JJ36]MCF6524041.1 ATP-binding protein [Streptomyces sp. JJ36]
MSTTRPHPAGDGGPEPERAATTAAVPLAGITDEGPRAAGEPRGGESGQVRPLRQVRRLRLVGASGAVARARDFTRRALTDWGWLPPATADQRAAAEDVLLVVSELVTNACLHASGPEELRVGSGPKLLRLEVVDLGTGSPAPRTPHRAGRPGGHGMFIVQRLCLDWGVVRNPEGTGKTVWAELAAPH